MNKKLFESIDETGTPDMKYYAFDWDDNIMSMSTQVITVDEDGDEVGISTEDFAQFRTLIGEEPFEYDGHTIVGFSEEPFKYFRVEGDKQFIVDSMLAKPGPAWPDFVEAINNGSVFAIITARGHTPSIIKEACYNLIISNHNGIDSEELLKNLEKYRELAGEELGDRTIMIREYLDLCRFYPVSYGEGSLINPEEGKVSALDEFIKHIKKISKFIDKRAFLKNDISNNFLPTIGFSDDDIRNVETIKQHFKNEPILKTYSTVGGIKKIY
jgi:hypothetical protein